MTDVLLAHAFFLRNDPKQIEKMRPYPPLGTLYAVSNLRQRGHQVALFDAMLAAGEHEFEQMLDEHHPSMVVFYEDQFNFLNKMCLTHVREALWRMTAAARERSVTVIASGSDVTDHPEAYFERGVQVALMGEADHTLGEVVEAILGHRSEEALESIPGVVLPHSDSEDVRSGARARLPERRPDVFPLPAWDLVDAGRYRDVWRQAHGKFSLNMVSTRGCPFHCNWCAKPIWGQRYAMRSPANVAQEMAYLKSTLSPDHIWFADDIFGLQSRWLAEFADEVETCAARIPFTIQSRVDLMTASSVEALVRAGCIEVWLGVESGSQRILDAMDKGIRVGQVKAARARLREAGIRACFFIQFGYSGETFEDIMLTVQLVRDLLPDDIGVSVSYPLPGTRFHEMVQMQLDEKDHWMDSADLAMMFQGTYQTPFYRKLHKLLHRDLELRQQLYGNVSTDSQLLAALDLLCGDWCELGQLEAELRSPHPTVIEKGYQSVGAPDLSERWN